MISNEHKYIERAAETELCRSIGEVPVTALLGHPEVGASWEGWCIEQIVTALPRWRAAFYRDSNGQELDLILERARRRLAFEFKFSLAPELTRGGYSALEVIRPERTFVVCPMEDEGYDVGSAVRVCGPEELLHHLQTFNDN